MTKRLMATAVVVALALGGGVMAAGQAKPAADTAKFDGTWIGTFAGDSSGKVTVTLHTTGETPTGKLETTFAEGGPPSEAAFKTLTLSTDSLKASYEAPDSGALVSLAATLRGDTLDGTWSTEGSAGTWTVTRQAKP